MTHGLSFVVSMIDLLVKIFNFGSLEIYTSDISQDLILALIGAFGFLIIVNV